MTRKLSLAAIAAAAIALQAAAADPAAEPATATVTVTNIRVQQGSIMAALHDERGWSSPAVALAKAPADAAAVTLRFSAPPGRYGVQLFQDIDGNGELDANLVGIPTEPFGFSNDAPLRFGPPSFEDAAFVLGPDGTAIIVTLR